jgi:hypothetical protein
MSRKVLNAEERVRALFGKMRAELHELADEHRAEVAALRAELDGVRAAFDELRSLALARQRAEADVAELRRLREIGKAKMVQRDISTPLN